MHKMASNLYARIQQECEAHIAAKLLSLVGQTLDPVVFLGHVDATWQDHCEQMVSTLTGLGLLLKTGFNREFRFLDSPWHSRCLRIRFLIVSMFSLKHG